MAWILPTTVPEALEFLDSDDEWQRQRGVEGMKALAPLSEPVLTRLIEMLDDPVRNVRWETARTLETLGKEDNSVVSAMVAALQHPSDMVRRWLVEAIARAAFPEKRAVAAVLEGCTDPSEYVRGEAINQFTDKKVEHPHLVWVMVCLLWREELYAADVLALQRNTDPEVLEALVAGLRRSRVAEHCAKALGKLGKVTPEIIQGLFELACSSISYGGNFADSREALGKFIGNNQVVDFLNQKLLSPDISEAVTAAVIFEASGDRRKELCTVFLEGLGELEDNGKRLVLEALMPWSESVPEIANVCSPLLHSRDEEVRLEAAHLLVSIPAHQNDATSIALESLCQNYKRFHSDRAVDVLGRLEILTLEVQLGLLPCFTNPPYTAMQARESMEAYNYDFSVRRPLLDLLMKQEELIPELMAEIDILRAEESIAAYELRERSAEET